MVVPTEKMKEAALAAGIVPDAVDVMGLPLRQGFWHVDTSPSNKRQVRHALGLGQDARKVVLVIGGGDGMGKLHDMVRSLVGRCTASGLRTQIVVVCGRNSALQQRLKDETWPKGCVLEAGFAGGDDAAGASQAGADSISAPCDAAATETQACAVLVRVLGFVDNVEEYMLGADLCVSKAGPGCISEAAACALPILLFDFLPGQEEENITVVKQRGMGGYEDTTDKAAELAATWLADEEELARMSAAAKAAASPTAAISIAEKALAVLGTALAVPARATKTRP